MELTNMVTIKGTTTIPRTIREELGIKPGDKVRFVRKSNGHYEIEKAITLEEVRNLNARYIQPGAKKLTWEEIDDLIDEGMADEAATRYKRSLK